MGASMNWIVWLLFIFIAGGLAYWHLPLRRSTWIWGGCYGAGLLFLPFTPTMMVAGGVLFILLVWMNIDTLRRKWVITPLFHHFKQNMPAISATEKEALEAGGSWWEKDLFSGSPDWETLRSLPAPSLSDSERDFLEGPVEKLCGMLDRWSIHHDDHDLPSEAWQYIRKERFFGMIIPESFGGLGFSALGHAQVVSKIASHSVPAAVTVMVPNSLGPAQLLLNYGTESQKAYYLPRLASGEEVPCFALTEPHAGSDAAGAMQACGVICYGSFEGDEHLLGIRLNWEKRYITLAPVATVIGLAFKLSDPDQLLSERCDLGITLALIPVGTDGVEIGRRHDPMHVAFMNGPVSGRNVFIPLDWVIGGREYVGRGWMMLMESLSEGRAISLPALSTGGSKMAADSSGCYARIRKQFRQPIGNFEGVATKLAAIAGLTYSIDAMHFFTLTAVDSGVRPSVASAIVKYHSTERMRRVVNHAMDIHGGKGICMGPSNYMAQLYLALPVGITVEGANTLTRSMIIFGQGAVRSHPWLLDEMKAIEDDDFSHFDDAVCGHIGYLICNGVRSFWLGWSRAVLLKGVGETAVEKQCYQKLTRLSSSFSLVADIVLLSTGAALKRKEHLSARLGDILSYLYIASSALKHFHDQGCHEDDLPLLQWVCEDACYQAWKSMEKLFQNLPKVISWPLYPLVFAAGTGCSPPSDQLEKQVSSLLMRACGARERLVNGCYQPSDKKDILYRLKAAWRESVLADEVERKIHQAIKSGVIRANADLRQQALEAHVITEEEAILLENYEKLVSDVIAVDSFSAA